MNTNESSDYHWSRVMYPRQDELMEIRVNGLRVKYAVEVDTDEGWVEHFPQDRKGNLKMDPRHRDEILRETLRGDVTVVPIDKNAIRDGFFNDKLKYLNGFALSFESHYLLTAPVEELMKRQRNRSNLRRGGFFAN